MIDFTVPLARLTESTLPPPTMTIDPSSFAGRTLRVRLPAILRETIEQNSNHLPADAARDLESLHTELRSGALRNLQELTPDRAFWDVACASYVGRSWLDLPWYFAEAYFYRRILEGAGYFGSGVSAGIDPFGPKKATEWAVDAAPAAVERVLASLPEESIERINALLHASLWGNRTDLSYEVAAHLGREEEQRDERANLLADDSVALVRGLRGGIASVALIADNAGKELLLDLALIDELLDSGLVARVDLHLKPQPLFVSDAMPADVWHGLDALEQGRSGCRSLAGRLRRCIARGELRLLTHWHYASSLAHHQMPVDLFEQLGGSDLVIVKGDANHRRLVGDLVWPETTPFAEVLCYFPSPIVALRTLKGGAVIGLSDAQLVALDAEDERWRENGQRGVIQAYFGNASTG